MVDKKKKSIRDLDNNAWNDFVCICKKSEVSVSKVIGNFIKMIINSPNRIVDFLGDDKIKDKGGRKNGK